MHWLTTTHVSRYRRRYRGTGHLWQGRFKPFPIEDDDHLLTVIRYVERNPVRANLVDCAADWAWSSLGSPPIDMWTPALHPGPVPRGPDWLEHVNQPLTEAELAALRRSAERGTPYGSGAWIETTAKILGLELTLRPRGRPVENSREQSKDSKGRIARALPQAVHNRG
jgi:putative transposase